MTHQAPITAPQFRNDLARRQQLGTTAWLAALMAGRKTPAAASRNWCLLEVDEAVADVFAEAHIPAAAYLVTRWLEQGPFWNKVPDAALLRLLLDFGIRHDTTVVLYGRNMTAAGRAAHLMLYAGALDVRLLDGGLQAWTQAGLPLAAGRPQARTPVADFGTAFPGCPHYLVNTQQVKSLLLQPDTALVSIRTWDEFSGRTSGYSYIDACGEIPGARWGRAGESGDMNSMSAFQNTDGSMKPAREIRDFWHGEGIHAGLHTAFYCGTGWRASLAFFYAWLMGWEHISVYDGGWFEWSSDPLNPRSTQRSIDTATMEVVQAGCSVGRRQARALAAEMQEGQIQ